MNRVIGTVIVYNPGQTKAINGFSTLKIGGARGVSIGVAHRCRPTPTDTQPTSNRPNCHPTDSLLTVFTWCPPFWRVLKLFWPWFAPALAGPRRGPKSQTTFCVQATRTFVPLEPLTSNCRHLTNIFKGFVNMYTPRRRPISHLLPLRCETC